MKGIKLHPDYQDTYFNDIRYKRIISYATDLGLIISVHAGQDPKCPDNIHCTPAMAEEVLNEVEPEKLVLAHMVVMSSGVRWKSGWLEEMFILIQV